MNIDAATRADLEVVIIENDIPCDYNAVIKMTDEQVREIVRAWILAGDECADC